MELIHEELTAVADIKNVLKELVSSSDGHAMEVMLTTFQEVVENAYKDMNVKILQSIWKAGTNKLQVKLSSGKNIVDFELDLGSPVDDSKIQALIDECEPWRRTNPELVESEQKLKEWTNTR